ncbi:MAG: hypothetical protein HRU19_15255 [Pseudobacteriovorax sp.]|nr:hypothetical protein [Pseudobacteriovorax sp.]
MLILPATNMRGSTYRVRSVQPVAPVHIHLHGSVPIKQNDEISSHLPQTLASPPLDLGYCNPSHKTPHTPIDGQRCDFSNWEHLKIKHEILLQPGETQEYRFAYRREKQEKLSNARLCFQLQSVEQCQNIQVAGFQ